MKLAYADRLFQFLSLATSRRGALAALGGALFAVRPLAFGIDGVGAKKKGKRRKGKKRKNKKVKTSIAGTCSGPGFRINESGESRVAQPFVALASGPLVRAELEIDRADTDGPGDYILRLSPVDGDGVPTNEVLAESVVADARVPDGRSTVIFSFADPFSVEAETVYALVLTRPEGVQYAWVGDLGDRCAGQVFFSGNQTGTFRAFDPVIEVRFTAFVRS